MMYSELRPNLMCLIDTFGAISLDQVRQFFSKRNSSEMTFQLNDLAHRNFLKFIPVTNVNGAPVLNKDGKQKIMVQASQCYGLTQEFISDRATALSILSSPDFGEDKITSILVLKYPLTCTWITTDDIVYDLAVFNRANLEGRRAFYKRAMIQYRIPGVEDDVVHLAAVPNKKMINELTMLGFDAYYVVDPVSGDVSCYQ